MTPLFPDALPVKDIELLTGGLLDAMTLTRALYRPNTENARLQPDPFYLALLGNKEVCAMVKALPPICLSCSLPVHHLSLKPFDEGLPTSSHPQLNTEWIRIIENFESYNMNIFTPIFCTQNVFQRMDSAKVNTFLDIAEASPLSLATIILDDREHIKTAPNTKALFLKLMEHYRHCFNVFPSSINKTLLARMWEFNSNVTWEFIKQNAHLATDKVRQLFFHSLFNHSRMSNKILSEALVYLMNNLDPLELRELVLSATNFNGNKYSKSFAKMVLKHTSKANSATYLRTFKVFSDSCPVIYDEDIVHAIFMLGDKTTGFDNWLTLPWKELYQDEFSEVKGWLIDLLKNKEMKKVKTEWLHAGNKQSPYLTQTVLTLLTQNPYTEITANTYLSILNTENIELLDYIESRCNFALLPYDKGNCILLESSAVLDRLSYIHNKENRLACIDKVSYLFVPFFIGQLHNHKGELCNNILKNYTGFSVIKNQVLDYLVGKGDISIPTEIIRMITSEKQMRSYLAITGHSIMDTMRLIENKKIKQYTLTLMQED